MRAGPSEADEVRRAVLALLAEAGSAGTGEAPPVASANALLARAQAARPDSPLIAAMRPLPGDAPRADLVTRLAALRRALDFV